MGNSALYNNNADYNTAVGSEALLNNTTGASNTATGDGALGSNTVGGSNVGVGYEALYSNVGDSSGDGSYNTAVGTQALYSNTTGFGNVASGEQALYSNTTGYDNVASGYGALYANTTGLLNTAVGLSALGLNTTGYDNTAVGENALGLNTTGFDLSCVGYGCGIDADGLSNATAIGAHARVGASNSLVLGGAGQYAVKVGIGTTTPSNVFTVAQGAGHPVSDSWETYSSRRWKTNIRTLPNALAQVQQLRGVSYDLKDSGRHEIGVIAEEVGAVVPELVSYEANGKDARSVDYARLTALLIEATKQQQREIRDLKSELRATRQSVQKVRAQLAASQLTVVAGK